MLRLLGRLQQSKGGKQNMKKMISSLLALMLVFTLALPAAAATSSVTYEGGAEKFVFFPGSDYSGTDLFGNFKGVMPGDTVEQTVTVKNSFWGCDYVKIYLKAVPHDAANQSVSTGNSAVSMNDFLSQLSMTVYQGDKVIYQASPDELDGLSQNICLGKFSRGQSTELRVVLEVPIELGNAYANRIGEVDWVFTAEQFNSDGTPKTGDETVIVPYIALLIVGMVGLCIPLVPKKRRKSQG